MNCNYYLSWDKHKQVSCVIKKDFDNHVAVVSSLVDTSSFYATQPSLTTVFNQYALDSSTDAANLENRYTVIKEL